MLIIQYKDDTKIFISVHRIFILKFSTLFNAKFLSYHLQGKRRKYDYHCLTVTFR